MAIEILLADDQFLVLESIKALLEHESDIEIVGTAKDGQTAIAQTKKLRPDLLLIDIEMPKMNGISATKYICKYLPNTKVIVLTSHRCQDYIAEALLAGASGYLLKDSLIKDLKQAIYASNISYSDTKAQLLTLAIGQKSTTKVMGYRGKVVYSKKYRKRIYRPAIGQNSQRTPPIYSIQSANPKTSDSLAAKFKSFATKATLAIDWITHSPLKVNRRRYRRIIWLLLAIASIVLSLVIF